MKKVIALSVLALLASGCGQGPQGPAGLPGAPGVGCSVQTVASNSAAPNGGALITCSNSQALLLNGTNGTNGSNGTNGTLVQPVQFCPGTPTYPSTFIENGFIIGGNLYAVYSANGGFMALIPPGAYSSNGIGSSCNFTVNNDLTISH